jgi:hypothetical protein
MVFAQSHKTDDYAFTCQVLSILRCLTEHEDKLYLQTVERIVLYTAGEAGFDVLNKNKINPPGNRFSTVAL